MIDNLAEAKNTQCDNLPRELHHYTTLEGLQGIIKTNTLWASHYKELNDLTEIVHLRDPLTKAVCAKITQILKHKSAVSRRFRRGVWKEGGRLKVAMHEARNWVDALYQVTFDDAAGSYPFAVPFITSFCSHAATQRYEKEHGLLSQWRGYGGSGGYCLVFDTAKLGQLLKREGKAYYWSHLNMGTVRYAVDGINIEEAFSKLLDIATDFFSGVVEGNQRPPDDATFEAFVSGATLTKHQSFHEEQEVRIVASPGTDALVKAVQANHPEFRPSPLKVVHSRPVTNGSRRYIALFESLNARLPIKRVIIGPSRDQDTNYRTARALLHQSIKVAPSDTPYIGG
jgi:Protein of unknown function (DUF2971)